eukprot:2903037-Prorocentrum_lima.AAC.1
MAHTGQFDGLAPTEQQRQYPELSNRQEVNITKGLIHMLKQQLKDVKLTPSSMKEVRDQQDDRQVQKEELYLPQAVQDEVKDKFRMWAYQSSNRIEK